MVASHICTSPDYSVHDWWSLFLCNHCVVYLVLCSTVWRYVTLWISFRLQIVPVITNPFILQNSHSISPLSFLCPVLLFLLVSPSPLSHLGLQWQDVISVTLLHGTPAPVARTNHHCSPCSHRWLGSTYIRVSTSASYILNRTLLRWFYFGYFLVPNP